MHSSVERWWETCDYVNGAHEHCRVRVLLSTPLVNGLSSMYCERIPCLGQTTRTFNISYDSSSSSYLNAHQVASKGHDKPLFQLPDIWMSVHHHECVATSSIEKSLYDITSFLLSLILVVCLNLNQVNIVTDTGTFHQKWNQTCTGRRGGSRWYAGFTRDPTLL